MGAHRRIPKHDVERHDAFVRRKEAKVAMYAALLETWERQKEPDVAYIRYLRKRVREIRTQLQVMEP